MSSTYFYTRTHIYDVMKRAKELRQTPFDPYKKEDYEMFDEEDVKKLDVLFNFEGKSQIEHHVYTDIMPNGKEFKYEYDEDKYYKQGYWETWLEDGKLHISSPSSAWSNLAGRHFVYDFTTKEINCIEMN